MDQNLYEIMKMEKYQISNIKFIKILFQGPY
jgi:hypothetical protein